MKRYLVLVATLGLLCFTVCAQGQETKKDEVKIETTVDASTSALDTGTALSVSAVTPGKYVPVDTYDPKRNAAQDVVDALAEAKRTNRRVLLEVGGLWCVWCRHMDEFFNKQASALALREKYFVTVKINYSDDNKNVDLLERYPKIEGFPHIFVLGADGTLVHSQDTEALEQGKSYSVDKFTTFLKYWATATETTARN